MGRDRSTVLTFTSRQYEQLYRYLEDNSAYAPEELIIQDPEEAYRLILEYSFQNEVSRVSLGNAIVAASREDGPYATKGVGTHVHKQLESQIGNTTITVVILVGYRKRVKLKFAVPQHRA